MFKVLRERLRNRANAAKKAKDSTRKNFKTLPKTLNELDESYSALIRELGKR